MSMMPRMLFAAAVTAILAAAPTIHAQPVPPEKPASVPAQPAGGDALLARQLATEGIDLAQKGDCEGALAKLTRAEALFHAPTILLHIGECQQRLGRLVDALSTYDRVAREQLGPTPPRAFVTAQQRAAVLIAEVRPKLGTLRVDTSGSRTGVAISIDGNELKEAALGLDRPIDPGSHVIEAKTRDGRSIPRTVYVSSGVTEHVTLDLPFETTPQSVGPLQSAPLAQHDSLRTLGWGLTIGGGVALVTSAVFTGLTLSSKSSLDSACADKVCPPSAQSDYDSAKTTATVAGIALGVGVVALGAGVVLLVTRKSDRVGMQPVWMRVATGDGLPF